MLNLSSIIINSGNSKELIKFYEGVFQEPVNEMMGWVVGKTYIGVLDHSEVNGDNSGVSRVMFNLETDDVKREFERISQIEGAKVIKEPYQMTMEGEEVEKGQETDDGFWIATLADPDNNYFQLMTPWKESSN